MLTPDSSPPLKTPKVSALTRDKIRSAPAPDRSKENLSKPTPNVKS